MSLWRRSRGHRHFELPQNPRVLSHTQARDRLGTFLCVCHRVNAEFIRIAGGAEVSDVAIIERETDTVNVIDPVNEAEAEFRREDPAQLRAHRTESDSSIRREVEIEPIVATKNDLTTVEGDFLDLWVGRGKGSHDAEARGAGKVLEKSGAAKAGRQAAEEIPDRSIGCGEEHGEDGQERIPCGERFE